LKQVGIAGKQSALVRQSPTAGGGLQRKRPLSASSEQFGSDVSSATHSALVIVGHASRQRYPAQTLRGAHESTGQPPVAASA